MAKHAAVACTVATRSEDNAGIDARLTGWGPFPPGIRRQEVDLKVQLKTTVKTPTRVGSTWAYSLAGIGRYDDLRSSALITGPASVG